MAKNLEEVLDSDECKLVRECRDIVKGRIVDVSVKTATSTKEFWDGLRRATWQD